MTTCMHIHGRLLRDAQACTRPDGTAQVLLVLVYPGPGGRAAWPVRAWHTIGTGHAAQADAEKQARTLRAGQLVHVAGAWLVADHLAAVLDLVAVTQAGPDDTPPAETTIPPAAPLPPLNPTAATITGTTTA